MVAPWEQDALDLLKKLSSRVSNGVFRQGALLTFRQWHSGQRGPVDGARGTVTQFSRASRLRLLKFLATINWESIDHSVLITLTYPDEYYGLDLYQRNMDRAVFLRHVERITGKPSKGIWRVEWVERKSGKHVGERMPHFHFVLLGTRYIHYKEINVAWQRTIGTSSYVRTEIKSAWNERLAAFYISKYVGKVESAPSLVNLAYHNNTGRHYGYVRKSLIPTHPFQFLGSLSTEQTKILLAYANGCCGWVDKDYRDSFTLLGRKATEGMKILETFGLTHHELAL